MPVPGVGEVLVVGCGRRPMPGAVNLDCVKMAGVDLVYNLDDLAPPGAPGNGGTRRLPFPDGTFDRVVAEDVLEHVLDMVTVVQELGRVLKVGGVLWVRGPAWNAPDILWADPTHRRAFAPRTFDNFDPETHDGRLYGHYFGPVKFRVVEKREHNKGMEYTLVKR